MEHLQLQHLGLSCSKIAEAEADHLGLRETVVVVVGEGRLVQFSMVLLHRLQQLTYLERVQVGVQGPGQGQPVLQPIQMLTRLADLRLKVYIEAGPLSISASLLSGAYQLMRLELEMCTPPLHSLHMRLHTTPSMPLTRCHAAQWVCGRASTAATTHF